MIIQEREEVTARAKSLSRQEEMGFSSEWPWMAAERIHPLGRREDTEAGWVVDLLMERGASFLLTLVFLSEINHLCGGRIV